MTMASLRFTRLNRTFMELKRAREFPVSIDIYSLNRTFMELKPFSQCDDDDPRRS